jgi:hypothetical protein
MKTHMKIHYKKCKSPSKVEDVTVTNNYNTINKNMILCPGMEKKEADQLKEYMDKFSSVQNRTEQFKFDTSKLVRTGSAIHEQAKQEYNNMLNFNSMNNNLMNQQNNMSPQGYQNIVNNFINNQSAGFSPYTPNPFLPLGFNQYQYMNSLMNSNTATPNYPNANDQMNSNASNCTVSNLSNVDNQNLFSIVSMLMNNQMAKPQPPCYN